MCERYIATGIVIGFMLALVIGCGLALRLEENGAQVEAGDGRRRTPVVGVEADASGDDRGADVDGGGGVGDDGDDDDAEVDDDDVDDGGGDGYSNSRNGAQRVRKVSDGLTTTSGLRKYTRSAADNNREPDKQQRQEWRPEVYGSNLGGKFSRAPQTEPSVEPNEGPKHWAQVEDEFYIYTPAFELESGDEDATSEPDSDGQLEAYTGAPGTERGGNSAAAIIDEVVGAIESDRRLNSNGANRSSAQVAQVSQAVQARKTDARPIGAAAAVGGADAAAGKDFGAPIESRLGPQRKEPPIVGAPMAKERQDDYSGGLISGAHGTQKPPPPPPQLPNNNGPANSDNASKTAPPLAELIPASARNRTQHRNKSSRVKSTMKGSSKRRHNATTSDADADPLVGFQYQPYCIGHRDSMRSFNWACQGINLLTIPAELYPKPMTL